MSESKRVRWDEKSDSVSCVIFNNIKEHYILVTRIATVPAPAPFLQNIGKPPIPFDM